MSQKLYVGNLSYSVTEAQLRDLFAEVGEVTSANVITDRETGRSRGFGFVEMAVKSDAEEAIRRLNGKMLGDREIQVSEARPPTSGGGGGGGGGYRGGGGGGGGGGGRRGGGGGGGGGDRRERDDRRGGGGGGRRY